MKTLGFNVIASAQKAYAINEFSDFAQSGICNWCTGDLNI